MEPFKEARADVITEFIEAAIHSILYVRGVYPAAIFKPRRKYGTTVHMCCHADINQYIIKSLKTVHSLLLEGSLRLAPINRCYHNHEMKYKILGTSLS
ncbi:PREDICTED: mitotic spindle assembly checkpoint protein MAD2B-like [Amphimedon queenslandica]|uniref:HORMA domain-containing protein n=1 Tax=Amphimedon queenslandica TaxID=400682 RepID=A0AAN0J7S0_AMPQE|nr:PREDICTED: mitotic spindle assembly checkpoint protein MAD2B-like [Amphimedon queenslandica]|eukprot:XP_019852776.1 PREDICTED: mitotic spindle assembly checkpoint protein MAD2B-like [Amphimedon queenslandica]